MVETEKLASLGQLVAGVAHEINNPLAFVSNNVAVLERDLLDLVTLVALYRRAREAAAAMPATRPAIDEQIAQLCEQLDLDYCLENLPRIIDRTREGLRRIERIVKDLRLFARVDEGEWNEVDLNPGIESSVNMVQGYARKHGVKVVADYGALPAGPLPRRPAAPGHRQPADERHRRLLRRRDGDAPHRGRTPSPAASGSRSPTPAAASTRRSASGSSTRSSPPSRSARGPGWACRSATGSSRSTAARSRSSPRRGPGRASRSGSPSRPSATGPPSRRRRHRRWDDDGRSNP